jgi:CTD nuclear envelope phosphatase 1
MNSLNILSHIGNTPPPSPPRSRAGSESNTLRARSPLASPYISNDAGTDTIASSNETGNMVAVRGDGSAYPNADAGASQFDEKTPLLSQPRQEFQDTQKPTGWQLPQRVSRAFVGTVKVLLTPIVISGQFMIACFYDDVDGHYSLFAPVYHISRSFKRTRRKTTMSTSDTSGTEKEKSKSRRISVSQTQSKTKKPIRRSPSITSSSAITSDSEIESERPPTRDEDNDTPSRHTRSKSTASSTTEEIAPAKRSIRIKLHNEEALRQRKSTRQPSRSGPSRGGSMQVSAEAAAALKSPTSPGTVSSKQLTRFPRAPQPPRPLVPRRQPSYSAAGASALGPHQKTLILDLDETLIHSMAKGGRFTTGHMVEVKLQEPVNAGQGQIIGPQIPILYYVHKRPHCDEFLKKVCRPHCRKPFHTNVVTGL